MTTRSAEHQSELERKASDYLSRIRQIDAVLRKPVITLIDIAKRVKQKEGGTSESGGFPALIAEGGDFPQADTLLTKSLCYATLQRIWRLRRRFPWLKDELGEDLRTLQASLGQSYVPSTTYDFDSYLKLLHSKTFGWLNPLTASQVARVLLESEDFAHRGMGFLTFFAMLWSLCRRFPDRMRIGARIEPWEPTAYVTAKCLMPLKTLQYIVQRRARFYERIEKNLSTLRDFSEGTSQRERWLFNAELDELTANLRRLVQVSIAKQAFIDCASEVEKLSEGNPAGTPPDSNEHVFCAVLDSLKNAFMKNGEKSEEVSTEAALVVGDIEKKIVGPLKQLNETWNNLQLRSDQLRVFEEEWDLRFPKEYRNEEDYWKDVGKAAQDSLKLTNDALTEVKTAGDAYRQFKAADPLTCITKTISALVKANKNISWQMDEPLKYATRWCRAVVDREIAHASAENLTDFEPSELVNGIAVAVRWNLMTTPLQVSEAVKKALKGAREDGSWRAGQPFYSPDDALGIWPATSDTIWTLTSAIEQYPDVREADDHLFRYVDWLDRRQTIIQRRPSEATESTQECVGWPSDRLRHRGKIHLATTAYSINALLEIRDLVEYRLWQLCEERFSVVTVGKSLKEIDPVDLGVRHSERLHTRLARMSRDAQDSEKKGAHYSLVLHGPPGSSKTSVAEALSNEMWKASSRWGGGHPRLLRITPADFTRLGEARIDSEARLIFHLIGGIRGATILFDEIDDLLRERVPGSSALRFIDLIVPAMLSRLADLREACPRQETCFIIATNFIEKIEPALIRKGRIDASLAVVYPDREARLALIEPKFPDHHQSQWEYLAEKTRQWPYLTIKAALSDITESLNRSKSTVPKRFETVVDTIIVEHESGFSKPGYGVRWKKMKRFSQELLNEHIQHVLSESGAVGEFEDETTRDYIVKRLPGPNTKEKLQTMINLLQSKRQS